MSETEFTSSIEEHETNVIKYHAVLNMLGYAKIAVFALAVICAAVSLFCIAKGARKLEMAAITALVLAALVYILLWQRKVRERIDHSGKIIVTNKKHLDELETMLASYPENSIDFLYRDYIEVGPVYASVPEFSIDVSPIIAAVSRERAANQSASRSRASDNTGNTIARSNAPARSDRRISARMRNIGRITNKLADRSYGSEPAAVETYTPSPQWEQYMADYKQVQDEANAREEREDAPIFAKVNAMKFLLM